MIACGCPVGKRGADEPTTSSGWACTIQKQIAPSCRTEQARRIGSVFITHDWGAMAQNHHSVTLCILAIFLVREARLQTPVAKGVPSPHTPRGAFGLYPRRSDRNQLHVVLAWCRPCLQCAGAVFCTRCHLTCNITVCY